MNDLFAVTRLGHAVSYPGVVVGLGARATATATEILALIDSQLQAHGLTRHHIAACATASRKLDHPALQEVANRLGVSLLARAADDLGYSVPNPSATVHRHFGMPSVAEAAALSFGPLFAEKARSANATCALSWLHLPAAMASSAASMLDTSCAGP